MHLKHMVEAAARRPDWAAAAAAPFAPVVVLMLPVEGLGQMTSIVIGVLGPVLGAVYLNRHRALDWARTAAVSPGPVRKRTSLRAVLGNVIGRSGRAGLPPGKRRELELWETRMNHGWSTTAAAALREVAESGSEHGEARVRAMAALCGHQISRGRPQRAGRSLEADIVIVSTLNLRGGTASANEAEILAYRAAGLRVALVHHPVRDRAMSRPIDRRLRDLIDGETVVEVLPEDTVRCDLAIVRFPMALEHLMDDRPRIDAAKTVLLVNQTPFEEYGLCGGHGTAWSVRDVHRNVTGWLGPHTWYAIGPAVRDVLREHHADELAGIDLADDFWYETIDAVERVPERRGRRNAGDPIRIGRHSRDHVLKFPNMAKHLRAAYPAAADIEVHMLGAHDSVTRILGAIPSGWTCHRFGAMPAADFLAGIDVYVYFIDESLVEAFGRAPLEAMAVGIPCVLPHSFAELFGDAAIYCAPDEVEAQVRALMADPVRCAELTAAGLRLIREEFSAQALLRRVEGLGVTTESALEPVGSAAAMVLEGGRR
ncbi:glycosyltransferase family protein [Glycomyces tenuis]|uniref:glycosyltransferase family protein n=1 Tax=Glycomyces tenuis TaxID=58116 RepID=UPI000411BF08|nr:glycosyltransferase [Glycomyces tenuis]